MPYCILYAKEERNRSRLNALFSSTLSALTLFSSARLLHSARENPVDAGGVQAQAEIRGSEGKGKSVARMRKRITEVPRRRGSGPKVKIL